MGTVVNDKPLLIAATTKEMVKDRKVHAGNLVRDLAKMVGGGGGGPAAALAMGLALVVVATGMMILTGGRTAIGSVDAEPVIKIVHDAR